MERNPAELKDTRILIIDDSKDMRELMQAFLERAGAETHLAEGASQGVERALNEEFDIVLMDIQMPDMNGHAAVCELRARGYNKPVVALTANALASEKRRCLHEGFDAFLTKPIEWTALIQKTQELLRRH